MLAKLAWRNIWRNKRRSLIVLAAIVVGMVVLVFSESFIAGSLKGMLDNQIGSHTSHIQIHRKGFSDNKIIQSTIPNASFVEGVLQGSPGVLRHSKRVVTYALISSASNSSGVSLVGVDPAQEQQVSKIQASVVQGSYLSGKDHEIILGKNLAERLGVALGDKVVAMASMLDGHVGSDVFRIVGLFETFSSDFDRLYVFIPTGNAQRMLGLGDQISEFAVLAQTMELVPQLDVMLERELGGSYEVLSYRELLPAIMAILDVADEAMGIYYLIIGAATIFGIVNAMLMSVFERIREFGVLMAMGMKNGKLFSMIVLEASYLGVLGMLIGMGVGLAIYLPFWKYGLDLSAFSEGLTMVGMSAVVYPILTVGAVIRMAVIIPLVAVVAALYPATKAIRLQPVRAIYYV
jgi:ABC-type lipoprotein release transport system permease subunit